MKNKKKIGTILLATILLAFGGSYATAQEKKSTPAGVENGAIVYDQVEEMPAYPGGIPALLDYINKNLQYPAEAHKNGIQGRVIVKFIVEKDGTMSSFETIQSPSELLSAEAIRVLSSMPKWKPGKQKGEVVAVKYTMPFNFNLDNNVSKSVDKIPETVIVANEQSGSEQNKLNNEPVLEMAEQMPQFPGGQQGLMQYLSKSIKYPAMAEKNKVQGKVTVKFIVDKEGNVRSPEVVRSASPELDAEAIRAISLMPQWKPGIQDGKAVNVNYVMPIMFRLNKETTKKAQ